MALRQHEKGSVDELWTLNEQQLRSILAEELDSEEVRPELIKTITDVLAAKTNEAPIDAEAAYQRFLSQYAGTEALYDTLPQEVGEPETGSVRQRTEEEPVATKPGKTIRFRRLVRIGALTAAVLALFLAGTVIADALGFRIWRGEVNWGKDNMVVSTAGGNPAPAEADPYAEIRAALREEGQEAPVVPTYLPAGYALVDFQILDDYEGKTLDAVFQREDSLLFLSFVLNPTDVNMFYPKDESDPEILNLHGIEHYITTNEGSYRAVWANGDIVCELYGPDNREELLRILDSIYKEP